ncbi:MAG: hypothetical protein ACPG7F_02000 [Aggregatilineales bacterium]
MGVLSIAAIAQDDTPQIGDPPVLSRIQILSTDISGETDAGVITVVGEPGAVFASARVLVRNLYTGDTVEARASVDGSFDAPIRGTEYAAYQINVASTLPQNATEQAILPGSPGTVLQRMPPVPFGSRVPFEIAGTVARDSAIWRAYGSIDRLQANPGDSINLQLDVELDIATANINQPWQMRGQLHLIPILDAAGSPISTGIGAGNGWSSLLTRTGLPVNNVQERIFIAETQVTRTNRRDNKLIFTMIFETTLPDNLDNGMYMPLFTGLAQLDDSDPFDWYDNRIFSVDGTGTAGTSTTRIPVPLMVGEVENPRLPLALFSEATTPGTAGTFSGDAVLFNNADLSDRVRYNSPGIILPPGTYSLDPALPLQLPNNYVIDIAPLIPFDLPGGQLSATIQRPDGTGENLPALPFAQSLIAQRTPEAINQSPANLLHLTTGDPRYDDYDFTQYGDYEITLSGYLDDAYNRRYDTSGTYRVHIAEQPALLPAVLPGTPFEEQDVFNPALHIQPGLPADVTITLRFYPSGRNLITHTVTGRANENGYFASENIFRFDAAGEYVVDYEVRHTDAEGRLWAGSLRAAGVVAGIDSDLIVHGQRGLLTDSDSSAQAWFDTLRYRPQAQDTLDIVNYPYHSGDVAYLPDRPDAGLNPVLQVQDTFGLYTETLLNAPSDETLSENTLAQRSRRDALPVIYNAQTYAYLSVVRPDIRLRQFVQGDTDGDIAVWWHNDETFQGQSGAGVTGNRPGDMLWLFGGVIAPGDAATYAAFAVITDEDDSAKIIPPFQQPLFTLDETPVYMLFHPTGTRPGNILTVGERISISGYIAPTVPANVTLRLTSPSGTILESRQTASSIGYVYDSDFDRIADEPGIWTLSVDTVYCGETSIGALLQPCPTGELVGVTDRRYQFYVLPENTPDLTTNIDAEQSVQPGQIQNFTVNIPDGWTEISAGHTVSTASAILSTGDLTIRSNQATYQYNPDALSDVFTNLESDGDGTGVSASDMVTVSIVITGLDASGNPAIAAQQFSVLHDRVISH